VQTGLPHKEKGKEWAGNRATYSTRVDGMTKGMNKKKEETLRGTLGIAEVLS